MLVNPSHTFTGQHPMEIMFHLSKNDSQLIHTIGPRVVAIALPLFAALDGVHHLINGVYKGAYAIASKVFTSLKKYDGEDAVAHFKQSLYFTAFAIVGSVASILFPFTGLLRLNISAIIYELSSHPGTIDLSKVNPAIQNDPEFIIKLVQSGFGHHIGTLAITKKTAWTVLKNSPACYPHLPKSLKQDKGFTCTAIKENVKVYGYLSEEEKTNESYALYAIFQNSSVYHWLPDQLKLNKEFTLKAIRANGALYSHLPDQLKLNKEFTLKAIRENAQVYYWLPESLTQDKEFTLNAIRENAHVYSMIPLLLRQDGIL